MSKRAYLARYLLIIKKLKAKPFSTYEELQSYIDHELVHLHMRDDNLEIAFSKRTLQRDLKEIRNLFGLEIEYSKSSRGYFISNNEKDNFHFQRMIESFDTFNLLNLVEGLTHFIHVEKRRPQGTENLFGLLHAIKNKTKIRFSYHKFWEEDFNKRNAEPYGLKEFKSRWYLIAKDCKDNDIKSFALDRLTDLETTSIKFEFPDDYNIEESYRYCFGIISPNGEKPKDIILSFTPFQGKYIKTLPLHHSQEILIDNEEELQIKLKLCITHDFIMELLSFGNNMEVIKPKSLMNKLKEEHRKAFEQY